MVSRDHIRAVAYGGKPPDGRRNSGKISQRQVGRIDPGGRGPRDLIVHGREPGDPILCGPPVEGQAPRLVETTCLVYGIPKGRRRWVVGAWIDKAITVGGMVLVADAPPAKAPRPTALPDGVPGSAPDNLGALDKWMKAFTPCVSNDGNPAEPGHQKCNACLAAEEGITPLERALRDAAR